MCRTAAKAVGFEPWLVQPLGGHDHGQLRWRHWTYWSGAGEVSLVVVDDVLSKHGDIAPGGLDVEMAEEVAPMCTPSQGIPEFGYR